MAINVNELILDKVRSLIFTDLSDGSVIGQVSSLAANFLGNLNKLAVLASQFSTVVDEKIMRQKCHIFHNYHYTRKRHVFAIANLRFFYEKALLVRAQIFSNRFNSV